MSTRKHKNDRFNQIHAGKVDKNKKGNLSRTAFAKLKVKPKTIKVANEKVKERKLKEKEIKRARFIKRNENTRTGK